MQEIDLKNCWCVTDRIVGAERFFLALKEFSDKDTRLYLEACPNPEPRRILEGLRLDSDFIPRGGTDNPSPDEIFVFEASDQVLDVVSRAFTWSGGPLAILIRGLLCKLGVASGSWSFIGSDISVTHVVLFNDAEILLTYYDAFMDRSILDLSRSLDIRHIERFCQILGVSLKDSREAYPEFWES